jgi:parallel beta-helix repeat protein
MCLFTVASFRILILLCVTLHVPSEFTEIQDAIVVASTGDTVLVGPGEYCAIDFIGKDIVVISELGPEYTSILPDGGEYANVFFGDGETAEAYLGGFAITGVDSVASRGVLIWNASPTISGNWIIDHKQAWDGCGILMGNSNSIIENNLIMNNVCLVGPRSVYGGGICCTYACSAVIRNNLITGNDSIYGGGIGISYEATTINIYLENNTIVDNTAGGGLYLEYGDDFTIRNCIIWGNEYSEISLGSGSSLDIAWSDIEGGQEGISGGIVTWGDGMIEDPPVFSPGLISDYELDENLSPCIDAGDPSPEYYDPENPLNPGYALYPSLGLVRNDMGAFGGGGAENWAGITVSPDEVVYPRISVVRNPCEDILYLRVNQTDTQSGSVLIMNLAGRIVASRSLEVSDTRVQFVSFSLHDLPAGMYAALLETGSGNSSCRFVLLR